MKFVMFTHMFWSIFDHHQVVTAYVKTLLLNYCWVHVLSFNGTMFSYEWCDVCCLVMYYLNFLADF
jgi:hypothetical protein